MELTALMQGLYGRPKKKRVSYTRHVFTVGKIYLFCNKYTVKVTKKEDGKLFFVNDENGKESWVSIKEAKFYLTKP